MSVYSAFYKVNNGKIYKNILQSGNLELIYIRKTKLKKTEDNILISLEKKSYKMLIRLRWIIPLMIS